MTEFHFVNKESNQSASLNETAQSDLCNMKVRKADSPVTSSHPDTSKHTTEGRNNVIKTGDKEKEEVSNV
jgi:hypothetical protein